MRNLIFIVVLLFVFKKANAQEPTLVKDENGKFIHYEVVANQAGLDSLKWRASHFFRTRSKELKLEKVISDTTMKAAGKLIVSKTESLITHPDGEVSYQFVVELKENKYRFWLTDFAFLPYQRDRYGNFVPSTSVKTALEKSPNKIDAGQWKIYQKQVAKFIANFSGKFKGAMSTATTGAVAPKQKVVTKEW